jgi:hypothetical protein
MCVNINLVGLASALATFFGVWFGHVFVRKVERETVNLRIPISLTFVLGVALGAFSFLTPNLILSAVSGIFAMTLVWDSYEFIRQQKRIKRGRAPANPNNPRHAKILAEYPDSTTVDWLHRDPRGIAYSSAELVTMKEGAK